jgi:hypothetical protein
LYPLVAPHVVRRGVRYDADDGVRPGAPSVIDLDGRDPGWTTIDELTGVEQWRPDPGILARVFMGIGATAGGRLDGSSEREVAQLVVTPGMAPYFGTVPERPATEPAPPAYMSPYPAHNGSAGLADSVALAIDGVGGAVNADRGSYAAYDIVFQQNADGRTRALYKRVYVGFDDRGVAQPESVWVTGPDANDHVLINYAH